MHWLLQLLWNSINKDWIAAQKLKKANKDAADAAAAEVQRVAAENAAAVAGAGGAEGPRVLDLVRRQSSGRDCGVRVNAWGFVFVWALSGLATQLLLC